MKSYSITNSVYLTLFRDCKANKPHKIFISPNTIYSYNNYYRQYNCFVLLWIQYHNFRAPQHKRTNSTLCLNWRLQKLIYIYTYLSYFNCVCINGTGHTLLLYVRSILEPESVVGTCFVDGHMWLYLLSFS